MILKFMWKNKCSAIINDDKKKQNSDRRCISWGPIRTLMTYPGSDSEEFSARIIHRDVGGMIMCEAPVNKSRKALDLEDQERKGCHQSHRRAVPEEEEPPSRSRQQVKS